MEDEHNWNLGNYYINDEKLFQRQKAEDKFENVFISDVIVYPVGKVVDSGSGLASLTLRVQQDGEVSYYAVSHEITSTPDKILELAKYGVRISKLNAMPLMKFNATFASNNKIPTTTVHSQCGWIGDEFVPYSRKEILNQLFATQQVLAYTRECGTLENWMKTIGEPFMSQPLSRLILTGGLASPLIARIGERSLVLNVHQKSGAGKTAALLGALSCWGDADKCKSSMLSTMVGLETKLAFLNGMLLGLDELQVLKDKTVLETLIYMISNGIGKGRGTKDGTPQDEKHWSSVVLVTSEEPISEYIRHQGAINRILELEGNPFEGLPEDYASELYRLTKDNYGLVIRKYLEHVGSIPQCELQIQLDNFIALCGELLPAISKQDRRKLGVFFLADRLFRTALLNDDSLDYDYYMAIGSYLKSEQETSIANKQVERFISKLQSNPKRFPRICNDAGANDIPFQEIWGYLANHTDVTEEHWVLAEAFKSICEELGYSQTDMSRSLGDAGLTYKNAQGRWQHQECIFKKRHMIYKICITS